MVEMILALCETGKSYAQIADQVKVPRPSVVHIIHQATRTENELYRLTNRAGRPLKLDTQVWRALICHMEWNLHDNLAALNTSSKLGTTFSRKNVPVYLKAAGYLQFKARRKPYLTKKL